jgi:hypothetical protein
MRAACRSPHEALRQAQGPWVTWGPASLSAQGHEIAEISDLRPYSWPCVEKRSDREGARPKRANRPIASYGARTFISLSQ